MVYGKYASIVLVRRFVGRSLTYRPLDLIIIPYIGLGLCDAGPPGHIVENKCRSLHRHRLNRRIVVYIIQQARNFRLHRLSSLSFFRRYKVSTMQAIIMPRTI